MLKKSTNYTLFTHFIISSFDEKESAGYEFVSSALIVSEIS